VNEEKILRWGERMQEWGKKNVLGERRREGERKEERENKNIQTDRLKHQETA
jgi:hypothetical protein